jgi:hypothetical protein
VLREFGIARWDLGLDLGFYYDSKSREKLTVMFSEEVVEGASVLTRFLGKSA